MKIVYVLLVFFSSVVFCEELSQEYLKANHELAIELLKEIGKTQQGNIVFSAFSLETVLALTSLGSKGTTLAEIRKLLQLPESEEKIKTEFAKINSLINEVKHIEISSANRLYIADKIVVEPNFIKTAADVFKSGVENVNFGDTKNAANLINSWISEKTHDKIKDLIKSDQLSDITRLVLVNAVYFKGEWQYPFAHYLTKKKDFHISQNETIQVDTMSVSTSFAVYRNDEQNVTFIRLPYLGTQKRAVLILVIPDKIEEPENLYQYLKYHVPAENYSMQYSRIFLPKFKIECSFDMKDILQNLGVKDIFGRPDLSGITSESLKVDSVNQKVFIEVDEKGTEAAVATSMIASARTLRIPRDYHVERPFLFSLQYDGINLFTGRVVNPTLS